MANILLDICLSDIPKEFIKTSERNGKKYLKVVVAERRSVDERGNDHSVKIYVPKEQRKEGDKPIYIGNGKMSTLAPSQNNVAQSPSQNNVAQSPSGASSPMNGTNESEGDDLPF